MRVLLLALTRLDGLSLAIHMVRSLHVVHQWQIKHVKPNHRIGAIVPVLMPQTCWREDQVASTHGAFLAIHRGVSTLTFHNHANRIGCVAMAGRPFTRHEQLHAQVHGGTGLHFFQAMAWIGQHQHATLGFFNRGQLTGLEQQRFDGLVRPMRGFGLARGDARRQNSAQTRPQGHQIQIAQILHIVFGQVFQATQFM